jgi:broad specificity phosphatase PhoE
MQIIFVRHGQSTENVASEEEKSYDPKNIKLTERGKEQAKITGTYIGDIYGNDFDIIYCSPLKRCVETCNIICNEMKYNGKIIKNKKIREIYSGTKVEGLSREENKNFIEKNKKLIESGKKMNEEQNFYKKIKLAKEHFDERDNYIEGYTISEAYKNLKKFINKLKKLNHKKILVVTHNGVIFAISQIISKINQYNIDTFIGFFPQSNFLFPAYIQHIENANCCIYGLKLENKRFEVIIPPNNLHLKDMNRKNLPENKNIYFIRHSEKLDRVNPEEWAKHERYKDKMGDTPITENGYKIAKNAILELLDNDKRQVENIYSSPAERCIQTALEFQKQIYKKDNNLIKIKVEYGLIFFLRTSERNFQYRDNKIIIQNTIIDEYMSLKHISERYGKDKFDLEYEPIYTIKQINQESNNIENQMNQRIDAVYGLYKKIKNDKINICCTHGEIIAETITRYALEIQKNNDLIPYMEKYFHPDDYCFWLNLTIEGEDKKIKLLKHKYKEGIFKIKNNKL